MATPRSYGTKNAGRGPSGKLRNFKQMSDTKFEAVKKQVRANSKFPDTEAVIAVDVEEKRRAAIKAIKAAKLNAPTLRPPSRPPVLRVPQLTVTISKNGERYDLWIKPYDHLDRASLHINYTLYAEGCSEDVDLFDELQELMDDNLL